MIKMNKPKLMSGFLVLILSTGIQTIGQTYHLDKSLKGFDNYIEQVMDDWNTPGIGIGIVVKDSLAYWKGFGYFEGYAGPQDRDLPA
jgi:hypothetical protein